MSRRAAEFGVAVRSVGLRDIVLPGDMKDLMNKVTEAKKAAEANLIVRREETAAMRSQANTAKLLSDNPTLMRLRELEVLEKTASAGNLNVVLGEKGQLAVVEATPERYVEKATAHPLRGKHWTVPTLWNGRLYVRNESELICFDLSPREPEPRSR